MKMCCVQCVWQIEIVSTRKSKDAHGKFLLHVVRFFFSLFLSFLLHLFIGGAVCGRFIFLHVLFIIHAIYVYAVWCSYARSKFVECIMWVRWNTLFTSSRTTYTVFIFYFISLFFMNFFLSQKHHEVSCTRYFL